MCPLAELLQARGHIVTGSDRKSTDVTSRLESLGISVQYDHVPGLVKNADILVYSSAIKEINPERVYARENGINSIRRAEMLGELMRANFTVCISGTHGKTTTTSLTGAIFQEAGKRPTVLVGGVMRGNESNAVIGDGNIMIAEADEFDRSFLVMYPSLAIITNVEADHLDCYGNLENIKDAFVSFTERVPFYGAVIACKDDAGVRSILPLIKKTVITYGVAGDGDYFAENICFSSGKPSFSVRKRGELLGELSLNLTGMHNVLNSLAAIAAASEMGIDFKAIAESLSEFQGVRRRFETIGLVRGITVIDDYAHHPGEIRATLDAARRCDFRRVIAVFQPHLHTRTRDFMDDFVTSLMGADQVFITGIYRARDEKIPDVSAEDMVNKLRSRGFINAHYVACKENLPGLLGKILVDGDGVIVMGAGDIRESAVDLAEVLAQ